MRHKRFTPGLKPLPPIEEAQKLTSHEAAQAKSHDIINVLWNFFPTLDPISEFVRCLIFCIGYSRMPCIAYTFPSRVESVKKCATWFLLDSQEKGVAHFLPSVLSLG